MAHINVTIDGGYSKRFGRCFAVPTGDVAAMRADGTTGGAAADSKWRAAAPRVEAATRLLCASTWPRAMASSANKLEALRLAVFFREDISNAIVQSNQFAAVLQR